MNWTSIKERYPDPYTSCLVTDSKGRIEQATYVNGFGYKWMYEEVYVNEDFITHWLDVNELDVPINL